MKPIDKSFNSDWPKNLYSVFGNNYLIRALYAYIMVIFQYPALKSNKVLLRCRLHKIYLYSIMHCLLYMDHDTNKYLRLNLL
jgi:hypothetical protein